MKRLAIGLCLLFGIDAASAATPLVGVDWIKAHSCDADVRVLDIRSRIDGGSKAAYVAGHVPCAVYSDYMAAGWSSVVDKVPGQISPTSKLEKLIGDLGIDNKTHVVIYHAGKSALDAGSATRVYWTFKVLGHDNVSLLDGGWAAYLGDPKAPKNTIENGENSPKPKAFKANLRKDMIANKAEVAALIGKPVPLIDMRPPDQFVGVNRHPKAARNGTIPGASNLPESWVTENNGGRFRSTQTLKSLYASASVPTSGEQVYFCNSGHWGSLGWFVASELLGNKNAKVYDGSMIEWSADKSLPVAQQVKLD